MNVVSEYRSTEEKWIFDPSIANIDRGIRNELRSEAEAEEADVFDADLRERFVSDVALDIRNRGDFVVIATSFRNFTGYVTYAAGDLLTLRSKSFEVDISLPDIAYLKVIKPGHVGGAPNKGGPGTFEMRLMERRSPIERVEIGYRRIGETVIGKIVAVGQDHVILIDDHNQEWTIPLTAIAWVIRRIGRR